MNERDILRRQLHDDIVGTVRKRQNPPPPQQMLGKVLACHVLGRRKSCPAARIAAEAYNNHPDLLKAMAAPGLIGKSAMTPAQTTVSQHYVEASHKAKAKLKPEVTAEVTPAERTPTPDDLRTFGGDDVRADPDDPGSLAR